MFFRYKGLGLPVRLLNTFLKFFTSIHGLPDGSASNKSSFILRFAEGLFSILSSLLSDFVGIQLYSIMIDYEVFYASIVLL